VTVEDVTNILLDVYVEQVDQSPYEALKQFLRNLEGSGPDEVTVTRFEPSSVPAILMVKSAANPEQAVFLDRLLREGASILGQKVRNVMESELSSARGGKSLVTV